MNKRNLALGLVLCLGSLTGGVLIGQGVNPHRHPNLAAAQRLIAQAAAKIDAAQGANEWDMNGHAQKAKELLSQADHELNEAAGAANRNH